jgi:hypothetical protein
MKAYSKYLHRYYLAILMSALIFSSCTKQELDAPDFNVTVEKTTVAMDEPITFQFTGTADIVTFFSGEEGAEYKFKDRTTVDGKPQMQFTSYLQAGASTQTHTLSLLVSNDFNGTYDVENLKAATWTDITSRASLSTGDNDTPSGIIDLTDQMSGNVPVYIAFRYTAKKDAAAAQPKWTIKNIAIDNVADDNTTISIAKQSNLSWGSLSVLNSANLWAYNSSSLTFTGGGIDADDNEDWVISQPVQLNRAPRDYGKSIKPSATTRLVTYTFDGYSQPGTYIASFEAINANRWDEKKVLKQFTFTVQ